MEEPTRLFVLRHGQTAWNAQLRIQGHLDMPLNAVGRWQATRLAAALQGEELAAVYSSDLSRARETAEPLATLLQLPLVLPPDAADKKGALADTISLGVTDSATVGRWLA